MFVISGADILLLKDEPNPKCFTRTEEDFTCFFETADSRTYDLFYVLRIHGKSRCEMSSQRTEEATFLHICSFPKDRVYLFDEYYLEVVERSTNTILYNRTVSVEDHSLLDPPYNVSLQKNGQAGQLQVSWKSNVDIYRTNYMKYMIRYSCKGLGEKKKEAKEGDILDSLVPGEEVQVQVSAKCGMNQKAGHWSSWSDPAQAVVPQSADDISLLCYTSDLQNISCLWNGSRYGEENEYKLFYKIGLSEASGWTEWTECLPDRNLTDTCRFLGNESCKVKVKLSGTAGPLSRTFYTEEFTLAKRVKLLPPKHLRAVVENNRLCLKWEAPPPSLSVHLQYALKYQIRGEKAEMVRSLPSSEPCLDVPTGSQYSVKLRAQPDGSIYSGYWSDWSDVVTGDIPADKAKQCFEETTSSVVEVMSEDEVSGLGKPSEESTQLLSPEGSFSSSKQVERSPGTEFFPDYVTLNKDSIILCPKGNRYVEEQAGEKEGPAVKDELFQTCYCSSTDGSVCTPPCSGSDFLNHSYLPLAEPADRFDCKVTGVRGPGNLYTNLPCS
ncbi:thrombopoietin receptor [Symphorus nematophorus]